MKAWGLVAYGLLQVLALLLHFGLGARLTPYGFGPNFPLVIGLLGGLLFQPPGAASAGFFSGILPGALSGANIAHYGVSRTLVAFALSYVRRTDLEITPLLAGVLVGVGSVVAQGLVLLVAPPPELGRFIADTILGGIANAVVAAPLFALLRSLLVPRGVG